MSRRPARSQIEPTAPPPAVERWRREAVRLFRVSASRVAGAAGRAERAARDLEGARTRSAGRAVAREARALAEHAAGRHARAARCYAEAAAGYERLGMKSQAARVRKTRIDPLIWLGRMAEAAREARAASRIYRQLGDSRGLARTLMNHGNLELRRDDPAEAIRLYAQARRLYESGNEREQLAFLDLNEAVAHTVADDFRSALRLFARARESYARLDQPSMVAYAEWDEAWVHLLLGDFRRCLALLESARSFYEGDRDRSKMALIDLDRGESLLQLNRPSDAADVLAGALAGFRRSGMRLEAGRTLALLAAADSEQGDLPSARRRARDSVVALERAGQESAAARARLILARILIEKGDREAVLQALGQARRAGSILRRAGAASSVAAAGAVQAEALLALADPGQEGAAHGRPAVRRARDAAALLSQVARQAARLPAATAVRAHDLRARALVLLGDRAAAYRSLQQAIRLIEGQRDNVPGALLRAGWIRDKVNVYEHAVDLCLLLGTTAGRARAFLHHEQALARSLNDRTVPTAPPGRSGPGGRLAGEYESLRDEVRWLHARLSPGERLYSRAPDSVANNSPGRIRRLKARLRAAESRLASLLPRVQAAGEQAALGASARLVTAARMRRIIGDGEVLVVYRVLPGAIHAFLFSRAGLAVIPLPTTEERLRASLDDLRFQWDRFLYGPALTGGREREGALLADAGKVLERLESDLIAPLGLAASVRRIVIVPSGLIHDVPFAALGSTRTPLAGRFEIVMSPSGTHFARARARGSARPGGNVGNARRALVMGLSKSELPFAPAECRAVARALRGARCFIGRDATLEVFRREAPRARWIHLATHGHVRADDPLQSGVRMADGLLTLHELSDLRLGAQCVVLSGCETGRGRLGAGEEVLGLSHAFLRGGAESVVVSLWPVDDRSTLELMSRFARGLRDGESPASALRNAMLALRTRRPHPWYWAPFVLMGNGWR